MLNVDIGGYKNFIQTSSHWKIMDIIDDKSVDFKYDLNTLSKNFPFEDDSVDNYYSSHTIEHVNMMFLSHVFSEIYRTLKVNGRIRIVVPDFKIGMKWYFQSPEKLFLKTSPGSPQYYPKTKLGRLLGWVMTPENGHKNSMDFESLEWYLKEAKFRYIQKKKYNDCNPIFNGKDMSRYEEYSIFAEAIK